MIPTNPDNMTDAQSVAVGRAAAAALAAERETATVRSLQAAPTCWRAYQAALNAGCSIREAFAYARAEAARSA